MLTLDTVHEVRKLDFFPTSVMNSRLTLVSSHDFIFRDLQVSLMHKEARSVTPYVALRLVPSKLSLMPVHTVHATFELSIYNHSKGMYYGCKGSLMDLFFQAHPSYYS